MTGIGQKFDPCHVQVALYDKDGKAHGWEVIGSASWEFTGLGASGRSTAKIVISGEMRRRTRSIPINEQPAIGPEEGTHD